MQEIAIRTEALTRDFGKVRALNRLSLEVPAGIVFGFLGPNAAGKTTTIRLLLGLLEPTSGRAQVLGFDTQSHPDEVRARAGALLEEPGHYERLSALDNLEFYGRANRIPAADRGARIKELLTRLGLWDRRKEVVKTWSRGMKQKLAVARALLHKPALVFLDEPTVGLDAIAAVSLRKELAELAKGEGVTVFLTTHNMSEAESLCDLVGVISKGELLAVGTVAELRSRTGGPRVEVTGRGFDDKVLEVLRSRPEVLRAELANGKLLIELRGESSSSPLVKLLVEAGVEIEEVRKGNASLEEAFLKLVEEESA